VHGLNLDFDEVLSLHDTVAVNSVAAAVFAAMAVVGQTAAVELEFGLGQEHQHGNWAGGQPAAAELDCL